MIISSTTTTPDLWVSWMVLLIWAICGWSWLARLSICSWLERAGGEGDDRGWDGWMASWTRWTWVWVNSGRWWWTGRPGVLQFMGSQRVGHDWATELNWTELNREDIWELVDQGGSYLERPSSASFAPSPSSTLASACSNGSARFQGSNNIQGVWSPGLELTFCHFCHTCSTGQNNLKGQSRVKRWGKGHLGRSCQVTLQTEEN